MLSILIFLFSGCRIIEQRGAATPPAYLMRPLGFLSTTTRLSGIHAERKFDYQNLNVPQEGFSDGVYSNLMQNFTLHNHGLFEKYGYSVIAPFSFSFAAGFAGVNVFEFELSTHYFFLKNDVYSANGGITASISQVIGSAAGSVRLFPGVNRKFDIHLFSQIDHGRQDTRWLTSDQDIDSYDDGTEIYIRDINTIIRLGLLSSVHFKKRFALLLMVEAGYTLTHSRNIRNLRPEVTNVIGFTGNDSIWWSASAGVTF